MANFKETFAGILDTDARLTDSGTLGNLLGYNATTKPECVFFQFPPARVTPPIITYSINAEAGNLPRDIFFDVTVWGGDLRAIHNRIHALLHEKREITSDDFSVKGLLFDNAGAEMWDTDLKCYYQRARYRGVAVKL